MNTLIKQLNIQNKIRCPNDIVGKYLKTPKNGIWYITKIDGNRIFGKINTLSNPTWLSNTSYLKILDKNTVQIYPTADWICTIVSGFSG